MATMIFMLRWSTTNYQLPIPRRVAGVLGVSFGSWKSGVGSSSITKSIIDLVFRRQRTGSVICTSCGVLVGVGDDTCYNCGRRNPGLWGWAPAFRALGRDLGFVPFL